MTETNKFYSGWDIGGAHLKISRCNTQGKIVSSLELICPLWLGVKGLNNAFEQALKQLGNQSDQHFLTLTGESADCFFDRQQGVTAIVDTAAEHLPTGNCWFFSQSEQWLPPEQAKIDWQQIASMNWLASATWLAQSCDNALFIDIGSTTTDLIPIIKNRPKITGFNDQSRLRCDELLYTGVVRTPLMALAQQVPFAGQLQKIANEKFATTGDIWRLLGKLPASLKDSSADGRDWQLAACQQRLARMLGTDASQAKAQDWQDLAAWYGEQQTQLIVNACQSVLSQSPLPTDTRIIGAGCGRFLIAEVATRLEIPYQDIAEQLADDNAAVATPASALALLGRQQLA